MAMERHAAQFSHYDVPIHLREEALLKALSNEYGCPLLRREVVDGKTTVVAARCATPESGIWVLDHAWLFQTARNAREELESNETLRHKIQKIASHFTPEVATVDDIVVNLVHCAYSIKFGHNASDLYHYVLDDVGALLRCAKSNINVKIAPLFCVDTGKLVSLIWPVAMIAAGDEIVRPHATKISLIQLGKQTYWESRYEDEDEFDWYCSYAIMRDLFRRYAAPLDAVLIAGSGASTLPIDMEKDGFCNVTATDYAANVVKNMQAKYADSSVQFVSADMTKMAGFGDSSVACIVDKGCLDTMLLAPETDLTTGTHVWKTLTSDNAADFPDAAAVMSECMRLLQPMGSMILLTYGNPNNRIGLLDWPTTSDDHVWEILECQELSPSAAAPSVAKPFFIYVFQKQPKQA
ncbi:hypothetical protein SPRG_08817 [Saprolegnia parasitica CBS 223.65]|uniref:Uncharacterized protein n=1 Tax=Saprolegnia parasitica (strain CBS 223.65) TaxID=695850 RepID=A0A067C9M0_SAPPC|nr:hypothetical protein SPRG_08817 [Saprolegnia parasitica CBS 223.65]KDO25875.1 hypothetical protein SPRG_08817 [Saprolegnia parasitica CBS 223.65]|eukprot:XP_012203436.1 hypothetical protein SPRG_08817 [Saprolegnia parasitica CBS 223.65]